jgi:hypothetical protein
MSKRTQSGACIPIVCARTRSLVSWTPQLYGDSTTRRLTPEWSPQVWVLVLLSTFIVCGGVGCTATVRHPSPAPAPRLSSPPTTPPSQVVIASWYGPGFEGRRTASGERFQAQDLTAAHRSLPLGSQVTVTNLANGKSVRVRINDRGPYVRGRTIDLSRGAARRLGLERRGIGRVRITVRSRGKKGTWSAKQGVPSVRVARRQAPAAPTRSQSSLRSLLSSLWPF